MWVSVTAEVDATAEMDAMSQVNVTTQAVGQGAVKGFEADRGMDSRAHASECNDGNRYDSGDERNNARKRQ